MENIAPNYVTNIYLPCIMPQRHTYRLRNLSHIKHPLCKTESYKRSFIPRPISHWNSLDIIPTSFRNHNIFFTRHMKTKMAKAKPPSWFNIGKRRPNILMTRLRLSNSSLNANLFKNNILENPSCARGTENETAIHYFCECPSYQTHRHKLAI